MASWHLEPNGSYWREWEGWFMRVLDLSPPRNVWSWYVDCKKHIYAGADDKEMRTPHAAKCAAMRAVKEADHE
jgi:hypothetical protein